MPGGLWTSWFFFYNSQLLNFFDVAGFVHLREKLNKNIVLAANIRENAGNGG